MHFMKTNKSSNNHKKPHSVNSAYSRLYTEIPRCNAGNVLKESENLWIQQFSRLVREH